MAILTKNYYSQFAEDKFIMENFVVPEMGFYLDVGCSHPREQSNTAFLRDMGWKGLSIDGNPAWGEHWINIGREEEFLNRVITDSFKSVAFKVPNCIHYARIEPLTPTHQGFTLDQILRERGIWKLDFLSLDIEGGEYDAMMGLDSRLLPPMIISEYNTAGIGEDFRVRDYLVNLGYRIAHQTIANMIFTK